VNGHFNKFVLFGSIANPHIRRKLSSVIFEAVQKEQFGHLDLVDSEINNFNEAVNRILSNGAIQEMSSKDVSLAENISNDILDFISKTHKYLQKTKSPFAKEETVLNNFRQVEKANFTALWDTTVPFVKKTYEQHSIDTDFYHEEFQKSLTSQKNDKNNINFESVKEHFTDKWGTLLLQKRLKWELNIIEEYRKKFCEELYAQIEQLKKLQELLEPFTNELGRAWDMSKGRWQKVNFDILKRYAEFLQKDASLQELAEMLGRMQQAECEYEEEIFADVVIKPAWKIEHASKEELIGIHESDDISSMLPVEAALLADETTELIFYKKLSEKKLQTFDYHAKILSSEEEEIYKKRQKEKNDAKGPFIICVDTSGSMHGTPEIIAKTLCFALLKMAVKDNRKCYLVSFSTSIETLNLTDLKNNLEKLIEFLSMSFHGGTDATPAMLETLRMLETEDYKKADVVMVSDFVMPPLDKTTQNKIIAAKENKTKFHSLVIGNSGNRNTIENFDSNWVYDANNKDSILQLVRDINGIYNTTLDSQSAT